jgi:hypothetical protein
MDERLRARFESALAGIGGGPRLIALARALSIEGHTQREVFDAFDAMRASLQQEGRDFDEDAVMGVMDRIAGWCAIEDRLFPDALPRG